MPTNEERLKILKMVQDGKISAEQAIQLLESVDTEKTASPGSTVKTQTGGPGHWFRVKVSDTTTGKMRANVRLPISLVNAGLKMGAKFSPEMDGMDMNVLNEALRSNRTGLIMDVFDDEDGEHVEIYIEE
jgi:hypothetical protein